MILAFMLPTVFVVVVVVNKKTSSSTLVCSFETLTFLHETDSYLFQYLAS